jgi:hypothetical protein
MIGTTKTTVLALTLVSLLAAPFADAARLGKSRNSGMYRTAPSQTVRAAPAPAPLQPVPQAPAQPQPAPRKGPGIGTAIAAGAAGAAAGYMLGHATSANAAPPAQTAPAPNGSTQSWASAPAAPAPSFPWGTLALVGLAVLGAYLFFRRRSATGEQMRRDYQPEPQAAMQPGQAFPPIPQIGSGMPGFNQPAVPSRLPDGTETPNFLRQAKATFLHLQSLNTPESVEEIRRYMTPELFNELRNDIATNGDVADFPQLECNLLEAVQEGGRYIASVRFSGTVSESVGAPTQPFSETWHYLKDPAVADRWVVAGIQQA